MRCNCRYDLLKLLRYYFAVIENPVPLPPSRHPLMISTVQIIAHCQRWQVFGCSMSHEIWTHYFVAFCLLWSYHIRMTSHERHNVSNQCLFNSLAMLSTKKTSQRHITGHLWGDHRWPVNSPHKGAVMPKAVRQICTQVSCALFVVVLQCTLRCPCDTIIHILQIASLALGQSYDSSSNEVTLTNIGNIHRYEIQT